ncbi:Kinesin-like protein KIN-14J [Frankliniella fusca]|uniref:Kinesin-like protein KIN-14J n=1 Tax=Frankliniella fusca TaxID=407009 RepID=A0AAE1GZ18_9NEOP|nr:Kinesin-like protein KIN-14J [Frankliniella fusca]
MPTCSSCQEQLPLDYVQCTSSLQCKYHFGCSGIQESTWRKLGSQQQTWKCQTCRKQAKGPDNNAPVSPNELRQFMASVTEKLAPVEVIKDTVQDLKSSVEFMSNKYDELLSRIEEMEHEKHANSELINQLQLSLKAKEKEISNLQARMREAEQYSRNKNIEITGLEVVKGENLMSVMENIARIINVPFNENDIDVIHRLPSRRGEGHSPVVAQFTCRKTRNLWLKNKKKANILSCEVTEGKAVTRIYLNTHLTPEWKNLLWQTKQQGRPKGYKLIWFQENKIMAKKDVNDERAIIIKNNLDLEDLV